MKNFLSIFGIIAILIFAFSYTGNNVMSTKPVAPSQTIAFTRNYDNVSKDIVYWSKKGFIVQNTIASGYYTTVIMVKY